MRHTTSRLTRLIGKLIAFVVGQACWFKDQADAQFGDQHFKTAIALIELYHVRHGSYPDSLAQLDFTGSWDQVAISSVAYRRLPSGYELDLTRGWIGRAPLLAFAGGNLFFNRDNDMYQALVTFFGTVIGTPVAVEELNDPPGTVGEITVRQDGREIFFWSSTRPGGLGQSDIWVATRRSIRDPWSPPQPLGPPVNTAAGELGPGLSWDGETLLFVGTQTRGGSLGFQDVWMSTRDLWPR